MANSPTLGIFPMISPTPATKPSLPAAQRRLDITRGTAQESQKSRARMAFSSRLIKSRRQNSPILHKRTYISFRRDLPHSSPTFRLDVPRRRSCAENLIPGNIRTCAQPFFIADGDRERQVLAWIGRPLRVTRDHDGMQPISLMLGRNSDFIEVWPATK